MVHALRMPDRSDAALARWTAWTSPVRVLICIWPLNWIQEVPVVPVVAIAVSLGTAGGGVAVALVDRPESATIPANAPAQASTDTTVVIVVQAGGLRLAGARASRGVRTNPSR